MDTSWKRQVVEATDLAKLLEERGVTLAPHRGRLIGICPLHAGRDRSLEVFGEHGHFICRVCGNRGDALTLVMMLDECSAIEALSRLAERAGVAVPDPAVRDPELSRERLRKLQAMCQRRSETRSVKGRLQAGLATEFAGLPQVRHVFQDLDGASPDDVLAAWQAIGKHGSPLPRKVLRTLLEPDSE